MECKLIVKTNSDHQVCQPLRSSTVCPLLPVSRINPMRSALAAGSLKCNIHFAGDSQVQLRSCHLREALRQTAIMGIWLMSHWWEVFGPFVSFNISPTDRDVGKEILIFSYQPRLCLNYSNNSINVSFSFCWSQNLGHWHFTMKKIPELQLSSLCNNFYTFGFDLTL